MLRDCKRLHFVKLSISVLSLLTMTSVAMTSALAASPREDQTRYGLASGNGPLNTLLINGHPTTPKIAGNSTLFVSKIGEVGDTDVLLLTSVGGEACEAQYSIVRVTSSGIEPPTTFFGNCATAKAEISGGQVTVKFPKNDWKYSKKPAETEIYDLATGTLKKNGKIIPSACKLDDGVCQG